jgi:phosphatidylglycerol:prolipoprotein diacylglycerol transferase
MGECFLIEHIRINFKYRFFGFTFTSRIIGSLMLLGGLTGLVIITLNKLEHKPLVT